MEKLFLKIILVILSFLGLSCDSSRAKESFMIGIGLPLTGSLAHYGQMAKKGFELGLEEINAAGGIHGRLLEVDFQDDQSDLKQAIAVAQRFISHPRVLLVSEYGTNPAQAVSPLYQRAALPHLVCFTSEPSVTDIGNYIWCMSKAPSQIALAQARYAKDLGLKKVAVFSVRNDAGKTNSDQLIQALNRLDIALVLHESYLPDEKDFHSLTSKIKTLDIDGFLLFSYLVDGSLLIRQLRAHGLKQPIVAHPNLASKQFPLLANSAAEGTYVVGLFSAHDPRPEVVQFVQKWSKKYPEQEADLFSIHAYDGIRLMAEALKLSQGTRSSVNDSFAKIKDFSSVIPGGDFNSETRCIDHFVGVRLVVKNGRLDIRQ